MTRINLLPVSELNDVHLMAEYRELPMVPAALKRSLRTQMPDVIRKKIPRQFTLNKGHVLFFYDKLGYLSERYKLLVDELVRRGYKLDPNRNSGFDGIDSRWFGNFTPTNTDMNIVRDRIKLRISQNKTWYSSRGITAE